MSLEPALLNLIIVDGFCVMHNTLFAVVVHRSRSRFLASAINSFYDTKFNLPQIISTKYQMHKLTNWNSLLLSNASWIPLSRHNRFTQSKYLKKRSVSIIWGACKFKIISAYCWLAGYSHSILSFLRASAKTFMPFRMLLYMMGRNSFKASMLKSLPWMMRICFRNVLFPLSPAPKSKTLTWRRYWTFSWAICLSIFRDLAFCSASSGLRQHASKTIMADNWLQQNQLQNPHPPKGLWPAEKLAFNQRVN